MRVYSDATVVREMWRWHLKGRGPGHGPLWDVLVFQAWQEAWMSPGDSRPARIA